MKKLLLLITGLLLLLSAEGQILRYSNHTTPTPSTVLVESINVFGTGGATTITTNGGTLQMLKKTLPTNATDTTVTWSGTNTVGTVGASGLITALTNGTVTPRATANDGSAVYGERTITISNQPSYSTEYNAVLAAMTTDPSGTNMGYQNAMVESLVAGGYWARMDFLYIFSTEVNSGGEALINWINPGTFNAGNVNSSTFVAYEGFTGNGTSSYIRSNYIPSSNGTNFTTNDAAFGLYIRTNVAEDRSDFGATPSTSDIEFRSRNVTDQTVFALDNVHASNRTITAQTDSRGLWIVSRTASTVTTVYKNGASLYVGDRAFQALNDTELFIGAVNRAGISYATKQIAICFVMDAVLNTTEAAAINTIFETYMDAIGKGVQ